MPNQPDGERRAGISAFFPAYNDAPSLPGLLERAFSTLANLTPDHEVIVVNDGSRDATADVLEQLRMVYGRKLRVITHSRTLGYGAALRSGFAAATKEWVFYTDGDGQYDPGELAKLVPLMQPGVGLVNGYKLERRDPRSRIWIGAAYNRFARWLFGVRIRDIDCDFRLVRRDLLDRIRLSSTSGAICVELVRKIEKSGCRVEEAGVRHYPRLHGRSQFFRLRSLACTLFELARLRLALLFFR